MDKCYSEGHGVRPRTKRSMFVLVMLLALTLLPSAAGVSLAATDTGSHGGHHQLSDGARVPLEDAV